MTEEEWLRSDDQLAMRICLESVGTVSERKLRLFAVACCRRVEHRFLDPCQGQAVEVLERYADGQVSAEELELASSAADQFDEGHELLSEEREDVLSETLDAAYHAARAVAQATCNDPPGEDYPTYFHRVYDTIMHVVDAATVAAIEAGRMAGKTYPDVFTHLADRTIGQDAEKQALAALLRDIVGNPFRPVAVESGWLTSTVTELARGIYEGRAFDRLPILADALQDAGCDEAEILGHCRGPGPHVRGCWVVDLVLGKS
jgi:hypothetical protein